MATYTKEVTFTNIDSGQNITVYTTEYTRTRITVSFTDIDISGTEQVIVTVTAPFGQEDVILAEAYGPGNGTTGANVDGKVRTYSIVVDTGRTIIVSPVGENNVAGFIHVERLAVSTE